MTISNDITKEPTSYWLSGHPDADTLWRHLKDDIHPQTDTVTLTAAQVKALAATQIELVAAPGADKYLEFLGATLILNFLVAYDDPTAAGDMYIKYTSGAGVAVSGLIDPINFLDATEDAVMKAMPVKDAIVAASACVNKALVLDNDGAEFTTGTGTLTVKITYLIHDAGLA